MIKKENIHDIYGLTPMQEGMLLDYIIDSESTRYIEQFDFTFEGSLDTEALSSAWQMLVNKYGVLRTVFSYKKTDRPRQIVLKNRELRVQKIDISSESGDSAEASLAKYKEADRVVPFNLSEDLLIRVSLVKICENRHHMVFTFHHIILDGWCFSTVFRDLLTCYDDISNGRNVEENEEEYPFSNYVKWIAKQDRSLASEHWKDVLDGVENETHTPFGDIPFSGDVLHDKYVFELGDDLSLSLNSFARKSGVTASAVFQTAWGVLLQKYAYTDDVVFGSVVSGRPAELVGIDGMMGMFINTMPMRVFTEKQDTFTALVKKSHQASFSAAKYEYFPLAEIQSKTGLKQRLISHVLAFENLPINEQLKSLTPEGGGLRITGVDVYQAAKFDFQVVVYPSDIIKVEFDFNANRFDRSLMESIAGSLRHLLKSALESPESLVSDLSICDHQVADSILSKFATNERPYADSLSIPDLFVQHVERSPESVALRYLDDAYSYQEVHNAVLNFAQTLKERGVKSGDSVLLVSPRKPEWIVAILGILYAGAFYVPIDPSTPQKRIEFIAEDCEAKIICGASSLVGDAHYQIQVEYLEGLLALKNIAANQSFELVKQVNTSIAYCMYTSGSTGNPKGCLISHKNVVRLVNNTNFIEFGAHHKLLLTGAPAFDATTFEIWGTLLNGGELCIADETTILDAVLLKDRLNKYKITMLFLTEALFNHLCEADDELFSNLEYLLTGGDVLSPKHIEIARSKNNNLRIICAYGPTENASFSTTFEITKKHDYRIPIGKPIANSTAYILDDKGKLLPPGAYGELCVGGDGVAISYMNRPELNSRSFSKDPFSTSGSLYRTGDIARWLLDGNIDFRGREDNQTKIRGYRIELGEIESAIRFHDHINQVAVIAHQEGSRTTLCAFYSGHSEVEVSLLRTFLGQRLPSYMVPQLFYYMPALPLNSSGKLDRRALPVEQCIKSNTEERVSIPLGEAEQRIADIFKDVLGIENINANDNFFELGATSLDMVAINNRLNKSLGEQIPVIVMFEHTSIAQLVEYFSHDESKELLKLEQEEVQLTSARNSLSRARSLMEQSL